MENETNSAEGLVVVTRGEHSFLTDSVDVKAIAAKLKTSSKIAVETLLKLLESKDERVRLAAAGKIMDMHVEVAKVISNDQMQRLIAEIKVNQAKSKVLGGPEAPRRPVVDFTTIREIK